MVAVVSKHRGSLDARGLAQSDRAPPFFACALVRTARSSSHALSLFRFHDGHHPDRDCRLWSLFSCSAAHER